MSVTTTKYLGPMGSGFTNPQLFECSDGKMYVVKLMSNQQGLRTLPNELIAYRLGRLMKLPVVKGKIVKITAEFLDAHPELKGVAEPGPHFGSLYIAKSIHARKRAIQRCSNLHELPKFIVFDYWINNDDRYNNSRNFIIDKNRWKIHLIDHGSCFCGAEWRIDKLNKHFRNVYPHWGEVSLRFLPYMDGPSPFKKALNLLESITEKQIWDCTKGLPKEWKVSDEELECLVRHLVNRKPLVQKALEEIRPKFPIWSKHRD
ncbi:hypothetical protein D1B31_16530 [Neobacillus notoginsengisoli]|uniref:HipA-like kinase domain-containing protein n=1 Tax=Neobacillus notoginsengisoli TaxID=1578198 RepID=A0A417YRJ2_9BACI|nr:HipA family kinase [Neobacillus notoginsengisoli]RHW37366.1 hypothetical protein D1B31_16530 [Neobacillus notoginsengisoli]